MIKFKLDKIIFGTFIELGILQTQEAIKEVKVSEYSGKMPAIEFLIGIPDRLAIQGYMALLRHIESSQ